METEKLYYQDCHCCAFSARVLDCRSADGGFDMILDRTAFFPEGGGQASDRGTLGGVNVLDVQEKNGEILHRCDGPLPIGADVEGTLDVARRQDLAQQHAGEHPHTLLIRHAADADEQPGHRQLGRRARLLVGQAHGAQALVANV